MKFTVKNKRHVRFENGQQVVYQVGDIIEANETEAQAFRDKFEPVVVVNFVAPTVPVENLAKKTRMNRAEIGVKPVAEPAAEAVVEPVAEPAGTEEEAQ